MHDHRLSFKMGEYFSGPGGLARGAFEAAMALHRSLNFEHGWAVDIDKDSTETFLKNIPGATRENVFNKNVVDINPSDLSPIDGFSFGFPCNDFSLVGKRLGTDGKFGGLYRQGIEVLETHTPKWFVAENVGGIRSANDGLAFRTILQDLQDVGYEIVPHLYKFEEYGLPQARHRVIIVGIRKDLDVHFGVPKPDPQVARRTAADALVHDPIPAWATGQERTRQSRNVVERLSYIRPGENAFDAAGRMPVDLRLNVKGATLSQIYRKLHPDRPSYTVTGSGGGGTHMYHWLENRALTNRERARLQTFPDDFDFVGTKESVRKQIGMAVPVDGAKVIFTALFKSFLGIPYEQLIPNIDFGTQCELSLD